MHLGHELGIFQVQGRNGCRHHPEVGVGGFGIDQHTRIEQVLGVEQVFDRAEEFQGLGGVHPWQQFRAGAPVAVLAGHRTAVGGHHLGGLQHEGAVPGPAVGSLEGKVDACVDTAVAEVPVGQRVQAVTGQEGLEVPQVIAQVLRRHGRVLPAPVGGFVQRHPGQPCPVGPQFPQRRGLLLILDDPPCLCCGLGEERLGTVADLRGILPGQFNEHPALPRGQPADGIGTPCADHHVNDAPVQTLAGGGTELQQPGDVVPGTIHRRVAEHNHEAMRGVGRQTHRGPGDDPEGALGTREELRHVKPIFRQQVFHRISGDLPGKTAEFGADHTQVGHHQRTQLGKVVAAQDPQPAVAVDDLQLNHVVGHAAVTEGSWPAGVVPDHPTDGAARRGGRVWAEPQSVGGDRFLEGFLHHPWVDHGGAGLFVDCVDSVQVFGDVYHEARADRVARA